jgi:acetyl-CoA carboxylase biotin carboxyl carrier protein
MSDHDQADPPTSDATAPSVLAAIDILAPAFAESGLDEVEIEVGEILIRLARPRAALGPTAAGVPGGTPTPAAPPASPAPASPFGEPAPGMRFVTAPLTGVWYASPSPGARPYLREGDELTAGQVVGLIEAMKLFNEIKADISGTVKRILVDSGTLVKRQQPLLEIDPR